MNTISMEKPFTSISVSSSCRAVIISLLLMLLPSSVMAQAFCALRDPAESIKKLYPEHSSYRSSVKTIDESVRQQVSERVPPHALHFSELGRHTLYTVYQGDEALGYVHVRSEQSEWGLVEIAWAIDKDLKVKDFTFQRCRNRFKAAVESDSFKNQLRGMDFSQMRALLVEKRFSLKPGALVIEPKALPLAEVVVRCGIKTLLVTELAWQDEVLDNELGAIASASFPAAARIEMVSAPISKDVLTALNQEFGGASPGIDRDSVRLARVLDKNGRLLGALYRGEMNVDYVPTVITWAVAPEGKIVNVVNRQGWQVNKTKLAFESVVGKTFMQGKQCSDRVELTTMEAVITTAPVFAVN